MRDSTSLVKPTSNMSPLENAQHELFAQRCAAGGSATSAYMAAGYEAKGRSAIASAHKLFMQPKVRARIRDLKTAIAAKLINYSVREKNTRLEALQSRWEKLNRVIEQRSVAPELQQVPGGDTGLVVRTRVGNYNVFAVDIRTLRELRAIEEQASRESGQWMERVESTVNINLIARLNAARQRVQDAEKRDAHEAASRLGTPTN